MSYTLKKKEEKKKRSSIYLCLGKIRTTIAKCYSSYCLSAISLFALQRHRNISKNLLHKLGHVLKRSLRRGKGIFLIQAHWTSWYYSCGITLTANHITLTQQIKKRRNGIILFETSEASRQTENCP